MRRTGPPSDDELTTAPAIGYEVAPRRLGAGDPRRPVAVALVIVAGLALAVWQPWTSPAAPRTADGRPGASAVAVASSPRPASAPGETVVREPSVFTSITDNEWTVVALVTTEPAASTEEPALPHQRSDWSATGPFLVLQQGLIPAPTPIEDLGDAAHDPLALCASTTVPRDQTVVAVPGGRVGYLGVTIPGTVPRAAVTATILGRPGDSVVRALSPTIELAGMGSRGPYVIPSTGPGGAILFALDPPGPMPSAVYRFTVASPAGPHYLYACVRP
jgi:hypothetical protein